MTHLLIIAALAVALAALVRMKLIQVDLFFPWFFGILILGLVSTNPDFVNWLGPQLGILYPPIAVVFLVIFLLVGILITMTVALTRLRARQTEMARHIAGLELDLQERYGVISGGDQDTSIENFED